MNILPFQRSYWVEPGRLLAGFFPADTSSEKTDQKLSALLDAGVTCVFNLMEADETNREGQGFADYVPRLQELARQRGRTAECVRHPIQDRTTPTAAFMRGILDDLAARLAGGATVYVHCWGGRGRTGTVIGCHLVRSRKLSGLAAIALLHELTKHESATFWPAPEMPGQRAFVAEWEESR